MADPCQHDIETETSAVEDHVGMSAQTCDLPNLTARDNWANRPWDNDVYMTPVEEDDPEDEVKPSGMPNLSGHVCLRLHDLV